MHSEANTPAEYLASLPADRRETLEAVRKVILDNLPQGYEEVLDYGMIAYTIPLSRFPNTYNGHPLSIAALAMQKNYNALYLMTVYGDASTKRWFEDAFRKAGKVLDMGKSCVRFTTADDLPLDVIGQAIARVSPDEYIKFYEASRGAAKPKAKAKAKAKAPPKKGKQRAAKKSAAKKKPAKSAAKKKSASKKKSAKASRR